MDDGSLVLDLYRRLYTGEDEFTLTGLDGSCVKKMAPTCLWIHLSKKLVAAQADFEVPPSIQMQIKSVPALCTSTMLLFRKATEVYFISVFSKRRYRIGRSFRWTTSFWRFCVMLVRIELRDPCQVKCKVLRVVSCRQHGPGEGERSAGHHQAPVGLQRAGGTSVGPQCSGQDAPSVTRLPRRPLATRQNAVLIDY